jgi:CheY-like chemotaxis protein
MAVANKYDLILMDIRMPGMDGMETTKRLHRYQQNQRKTPVIALTAHAIDGSRDACIAAGMSGFVTKPIDPRSLATAIMDVLDPGEENTNNPAA